MAMTCVSGDDLETLQAALEFVSNYDVSPSGVVSNSGDAVDSTMLGMIEEESDLSDLQQLINGVGPGPTIDADVVFGTTHGYGSPLESSVGDISDTNSIVPGVPWPAVPSPPAIRRRQGKSRKDEITELRKLVMKLTKRLGGMHTSSRSLTSHQQHGSTSSLLWKNIVTRQFNLRQQSESENAKLRKDLAAQAHNAANLKRMLKRRYSEEMLELMPMLKRGKGVISNPFTHCSYIFQELLGGTDHVLAGVDGLFEKKCMAQVPCPGRSMQAHRDIVNGVFLEFLDKSHVPFDTDKTTRAVWKALGGRRLNDGDHVQTKMCAHETQYTDDTLTSYFNFTCAPIGFSAYVEERRAARKYIERERSVIICRAMIEPTNRTFRSLGLSFQETCAIVVKKGERLSSGQDTSVIESFMWVTRCDEGKQEGLKFRDAVFADIALGGYGARLSLHNQRVENILFDEALHS